LQRHHFDLRVDRVQRAAGSVDLGRADRIGAVEDLALQVGEVDLVRIGDGQAPDARGSEVERRRAAEPSRADDQRARRAQPLLPLDPDLGEQDVPRVAEELLIVQLGFV
jgi:hypothetical protein